MQYTLRYVLLCIPPHVHATPMQLVYGWDAIHNIWFEADSQYLKYRQQHVICQNNERENARCNPHTYNVGNQVMVEQPQHCKYDKPKYKGPATVDRINDNGTLHLSIPKGAVPCATCI